jgi:hypothetical protein
MRPLAFPVALVAALALGGCPALDSQPAGPLGPSASAAAADLDTLTVARQRSMAGYSRDRFPHWRSVDSNCDVRDVVLKRDGTDVQVTRDCKVLRGRWFSLYDEKTYTDPGLIDIDHMVALANAWRSGADAWTDEQRGEFANDLTRPQLLAVSRTSNRAKGDQDPAQWKPPNRGYWCEYARRWVAVKHYWRLTVTEREKIELREMLGSCRVRNSGPPTSSPAPAG